MFTDKSKVSEAGSEPDQVRTTQKKGRPRVCESGPEVMRGRLSALEKTNSFSGHFGVFLVGAAGIEHSAGGGIGRFHEVVAEQVIFHFFTRDIGQHHPVDLDTRRKGLTGLGDHLGVVRAIVDDIDVLEGETVLFHDRTNAVGPTAGGLEIGFDLHDGIVATDNRGATHRP